MDTSAANLLLNLGLERLVVKVEEFLAAEGLQSAEHTLSDATNSDGTNNLALKIVFVVGHSGDVPVTGLYLLVGWDEVADEDEDGHDDMFGDGDDVRAGHFGDSDTAICLVGRVQVDVVGSNTGSDGNLELLRLG